MSKIKLEGNATGTGTLTISAPATNTDRSLTLPDGAGEILTDASTLSSSNLSGALPAIDGSALTGISGGKVLQVQVGYMQDTQNSTFSSTPAASSLYVNITPTSTSSIIYIQASFDVYANGYNSRYFMYRDGTALNSRPFGFANDANRWENITCSMFRDAPSTTSSVQYRVYFSSVDNSNTVYMGQGNPSLYHITAWEIDGS